MLTWTKHKIDYGNDNIHIRYEAEGGSGLHIERSDRTWGVFTVENKGERLERHDFLGPDVPTLRLAKLLAEFIVAGGDPNAHRPSTSSTRRPTTINYGGGSASTTKWVCSCGEQQSGSANGYRDAVDTGWWHAETAWAAFVESKEGATA